MIKFIFHFYREYYLTMVKWVNDQRICAIWTLRSQNVSLISFCDAGPWHCQTVIFFKNSFFKLKEA
jgi:hypothetical protein